MSIFTSRNCGVKSKITLPTTVQVHAHPVFSGLSEFTVQLDCENLLQKHSFSIFECLVTNSGRVAAGGFALE